ncbi:Aste57867_8246 [Aphanomyces stellatus]|uniref:Aste57867_8246 protein n=1 Tax=Aphanomyces stellatus TaxID=120398 RepID=A0A485KJU9_9STRA|nr:hypothetical protein As57867_008215 [Aphanomyces stellatus]VFT85133.1 Aste57867_8246 [Aphanomyces stellatus]
MSKKRSHHDGSSDDERKDKKKKSHKKHKKHKSSSSRSHHDDSRPDVQISEDDYFEKALEFRVWLKLEKRLYFDDLTSADAQGYFGKFVHKWNGGKLDSMYYTKIPQHILEGIQRTKHKWGLKMNETERLELASTKDTVDISTNKGTNHPPPYKSHPQTSKATSASFASKKRDDDSDRDSDDERKRAKRDKKTYVKHKEMVLEELAPKATGREATIEKKRQVAASVHGAARQNEDAKDGLTLSDAFLMGGSDDFQARVQRRKHAQDRRVEEQQQRVTAAQEAEAARMQKFLADMGIQPGQERITIAPRK